jgi:hypothetical protein
MTVEAAFFRKSRARIGGVTPVLSTDHSRSKGKLDSRE